MVSTYTYFLRNSNHIFDGGDGGDGGDGCDSVNGGDGGYREYLGTWMMGALH